MFPASGRVHPYLMLGIATIAVAGCAAYFLVGSREERYVAIAVTRGPIVQEASASGNVESPTTIDLQFQNSGRLTYLGVKTGDTVEAGETLARLDSSVLRAQLEQARAIVDAQQAQLASLQEGTRPEQIAVLEAQTATDQTSLSQTNAALINAIQAAYTQADDAVRNKVDQFFLNPRSSNPQITFTASDAQLEATLESDRADVEITLASWRTAAATLTAQSDLAGAAVAAQSALAAVSDLLADANATLNGAIANQQASAATLATYVASVATARTGINASTAALTTAITAQKAAQSMLDKDEKSLALAQAGSTASSIAAQQAQVAQAQASAAAIEAQIAQLSLAAPVAGIVTDTNGAVGETVTPTEIVVSMLPQEKLQVRVNLSEDNVGTVAVGQSVSISLDAFPGETWQGTVTKIDPAQTVIGGAIYYKTTVAFDKPDPRIRSGMTADVLIQTGGSPSSLLVPASAISQNAENAQPQVQVLDSGVARSVPVVTGLKSRNGMIEIISGLAEGQLVVTGTR